MRKLGIIEHVLLDGVIQHSADNGDFPYSNWIAPYRTPPESHEPMVRSDA